MKELANLRQSSDRRTETREILKEFDVIKKCCPKSFGCCWIVSANVIENGLQIS